MNTTLTAGAGVLGLKPNPPGFSEWGPALLEQLARKQNVPLTTLPKPWFDAMKKGLQSYYTRLGSCTLDIFCGKNNVFNAAGAPPALNISEATMARLPTLIFQVKLAGQKCGVVKFAPRQYMILQMTGMAHYFFGIVRGSPNRLGRMPVALEDFGAACFQGRIYIAGGIIEEKNLENDRAAFALRATVFLAATRPSRISLSPRFSI